MSSPLPQPQPQPQPPRRQNVCSRCRMPVDELATRCPHCTSRIITRDEIILTLGMAAFGVAAMVVYSYHAAPVACVVAALLCVFGAFMIYKFARRMLSHLRR